MLITGRLTADAILAEVKQHIHEQNVVPGLGVILVGDDAPSHLYVGIKEKKAKELGIYFEKQMFPADTTEEIIQKAIEEMNANQNLHGIIVQLPLPDHLNTEDIINSIDPKKDTDGFHPETIKKFLAGDQSQLPVFPRALLELAKMNSKKAPGTKKALAIVNSDLMDKVLRHSLEQEGYQTEVLNSANQEKIKEVVQEQDVIVTAVGKPEVVSALSAKPGAIFVDGGIYYDEEGRVIGDVARDDGVYRDDVLVTTVPGGVGPVTVAALLARVTEAALLKK